MERLRSQKGLVALSLLIVVAGSWYLLMPSGGGEDFSLVDIDGKPFRLSDFRGRVVLLDFMATWCGPCRASMSDLRELRRDFGEELVMISISVDPTSDTVEQLKAWRDYFEADWIHARDTVDPPLSQKYKVGSIPTLIIIDKRGNVGFRHVGMTSAATLKNEVSELLSK